MEPKYPHIRVKLVGEDGNAFAILGKVTQALKKNGVDSKEFLKEAMAGDYDRLLRTCMTWVTVL